MVPCVLGSGLDILLHAEGRDRSGTPGRLGRDRPELLFTQKLTNLYRKTSMSS